MFQLDDLELNFDDEIFDMTPKRHKSDSGTAQNQGIISFGVGNSVPEKLYTQSLTQSSVSSPPNILSHLNNDKNIQDCKKYFSQASKEHNHHPMALVTDFAIYPELIQSPTYSPTTSTQNPNDVAVNCFFDKTNALSPIRMKPGISSHFRKATADKILNQSSKIRKFPGPAGCLPNIGPNEDFSKLSLGPLYIRKEERDSTKENREESMYPYGDFTSSTQLNNSEIWKTAMSIIGSECWPLFEKYRLENLFKMITQPNGLPNFKIPVVCLSLVEIEYLPRDAAATMTDGTACIKAAVHRHVLQQYREKIKSGSVFVLKMVSVFSPSGKKYFLNITQSNVVDIFSPGVLDHESHCCPLVPLRDILTFVEQCNTKGDIDLDHGIITPDVIEGPQSKNIEPGIEDFFDDGMDEELSILMDESFPN